MIINLHNKQINKIPYFRMLEEEQSRLLNAGLINEVDVIDLIKKLVQRYFQETNVTLQKNTGGFVPSLSFTMPNGESLTWIQQNLNVQKGTFCIVFPSMHCDSFPILKVTGVVLVSNLHEEQKTFRFESINFEIAQTKTIRFSCSPITYSYAQVAKVLPFIENSKLALANKSFSNTFYNTLFKIGMDKHVGHPCRVLERCKDLESILAKNETTVCLMPIKAQSFIEEENLKSCLNYLRVLKESIDLIDQAYHIHKNEEGQPETLQYLLGWKLEINKQIQEMIILISTKINDYKNSIFYKMKKSNIQEVDMNGYSFEATPRYTKDLRVNNGKLELPSEVVDLIFTHIIDEKKVGTELFSQLSAEIKKDNTTLKPSF